MKGLLFAGIVGLGMASSAQGALLVSSTRTPAPGFAGFDLIEFHVAGYTGPDNVPGNTISGLEGIFSASPGAELSVSGTESTSTTPTSVGWRQRTTNNSTNVSQPGPRSFLNFEAWANGPATGRTPADDNTPTSFGHTWFTTGTGDADGTRLRPVDTSVGANDDGFDQTLLAKIFVTSGGNVSFSGLYNSNAGLGQPLVFSSAPVPEPAAFALLGIGALGLLSRRRSA